MLYSFLFSTEGAVGGACKCKDAVMDHEFVPQCPLHKLLGGWEEFCSDPFLLDPVRLLLWCVSGQNFKKNPLPQSRAHVAGRSKISSDVTPEGRKFPVT